MIETSTYPRNSVQRKELHYSPNLLSVMHNGIDNCKVARLSMTLMKKVSRCVTLNLLPLFTKTADAV